MRFLHTSDWHVGRTIRGRSRLDEFERALDQVVAIAADQRVDAVLVSGDLFDHKASQPDAERLVFETLARLAVARVRVVAIPGNHDLAPRWDALRPVLEPLGVSVVANVRPPGEGGIVEVASRDGGEGLLVACVPFVAERHLGSAAALFEGSERWAQQYAQGMGDLLEAMAAGFRADRVNVLLAHLYLAEVDVAPDSGENPLTITLDYAVPPARLPGTAAYVALGHVHKPQTVAAPSPARYAGSLLQLDFGERGQRKSVTVVESSAGKPARVREVPLSAGRALADVAGTLDELAARSGDLGDAWLRVTVRTDGPVPGIADRVREVLPNAVDVKIEHPLLSQEPVAESLLRLVPREQFVRFYRNERAADPPAEVLAAFNEVYDAAQAEDR